MSRGVGRRRRGRELALRALFELEGTDKDPAAVLDYHAHDLGAAADVVAFARQIITGCVTHGDDIDVAIRGASRNWELADIGKVERALLRVGTFELIYAGDAPVAVVIDESVEIAKTYAGDEAGPFVNGVLGEIARRREASGAS